ncbi:MAG: histidinol dehydrogenase [Thaumarchaeota archaeon]|jgi:histidinol dehydrogenase|nr:histidinol dehydrogenase [Nitrososphaerota archaeon]|tara:strand:- start:2707 stop:4014 length:1308 start_codon:yes stop_codon:yes gene_type:complete
MKIQKINLENGDFQKVTELLRRKEKTYPSIRETVAQIVEEVRTRGDQALLEYTRRFDSAVITRAKLRVKPKEMEDAYRSIPRDRREALVSMKRRIESFEERLLKQRRNFIVHSEGLKIERALKPIESVGCYVPGGTAAYPSSLLMTCVPARVAGVERIVICSPPLKNGSVNSMILAASHLCGIKEFYRIGGAQAIAAMAHGTRIIRPVNKIVGPGNVYVQTAKTLLASRVALDMPAGPSELIIVGDERSNPSLVARDMMSQAEHGDDSYCGLITPSETLATEVIDRLEQFIRNAPRKAFILRSLQGNGFVVVTKSIESCWELVSKLAPEHVEVMTKNPEDAPKFIRAAGTILLGPYSPAALSDYCTGTNHVLPTGGGAKSYSGLSCMSFTNEVNIVRADRGFVSSIIKEIQVMAVSEGLENHFLSVSERLSRRKN